MNPSAYKYPEPVRVQLGDTPWFLSPLPQSAVEAAERSAEAHFRNLCPFDISEDVCADEVAVQTISRASGVDPTTTRSLLDRAELTYLYEQWSHIQTKSMPDLRDLREALRKRVNLDGNVMIDGLAAYHSENAGTYYGKPINDLTVGQLFYFLYLRSAYDEFHGPESAGKKVSREWLMRE